MSFARFLHGTHLSFQTISWQLMTNLTTLDTPKTGKTKYSMSLPVIEQPPVQHSRQK